MVLLSKEKNNEAPVGIQHPIVTSVLVTEKLKELEIKVARAHRAHGTEADALGAKNKMPATTAVHHHIEDAIQCDKARKIKQR